MNTVLSGPMWLQADHTRCGHSGDGWFSMPSPLPPQFEMLSLPCSFWPCDYVLRASEDGMRPPHTLGPSSEGSASTMQQNQTQAKGVQRAPANLSGSKNIVTWPGNYRAARVEEPGPMSYFIEPLPQQL